MSASFALLNRIKTLESQKKRNNQLSSTAIKAAAAAAAAAASAAISATPISNNNNNNNNSYRINQNNLNSNNNNNLNNANLNSTIVNFGNSLNNNIFNLTNTTDQIETMHVLNNATGMSALGYVSAAINANYNNNNNNNGNNSGLSPNTERKSAKFNHRQSGVSSKMQDDSVKSRVKSANPNVYKDKITDQKFFNRNFKVKNDGNNTNMSNNVNITDFNGNYAGLNNYNTNMSNNNMQQRYLNDSPSTSDSLYHSSRLHTNGNNVNLSNSNGNLNEKDYLISNHSPVSQTNLNLQTTQYTINSNTTTSGINTLNNQQTLSNTNQLNKLKLLKKRNALKKSLSNANSIQNSVNINSHMVTNISNLNISNNNINSSNNRSNNNLSTISNSLSKSQNLADLANISSSKEDIKSHNSLNNLNNSLSIATKNMSRHLSRQSLNTVDSNMNTSFNTFNNSNNHSYSYHNLNNINTNNIIGNNMISHHKSSETVDELALHELKLKELNNLNSNFKARSSGCIANNSGNLNAKAKSENELADESLLYNTNHNGITMNGDKLLVSSKPNHLEEDELGEIDLDYGKKHQIGGSVSQSKFEKKYNNTINNGQTQDAQQNDPRLNKALMANSSYLNRVKTVSVANPYSNQNTTQNRSVLLISTNNNYSSFQTQRRDKSNDSSENNEIRIKSKLSNENLNEIANKSILKHVNQNDDFKFSNPNGGVEIIKPVVLDEYGLEPIDPNNIMSDPVIYEQFRKLYEEDEYFQQVHKKCCEWLLRYVIPEMELLKATKNNN